ncbi:hypothetical protein V5799_028062 [Amblyomma americanum]|uniref:Uncharacterized protein n=1 Tax=Amblyomma americanum TaxID=6943 RepID=A0AAQ4DDY4_AMBAM
MHALTLALTCSLLVAGAHCAAVVTYGVPAAVVHTPVVHQTVVRRPSVTQHHEVLHVPHHEFGYSVEHSKVVQPKTSVVHHHPLTGVPVVAPALHHTVIQPAVHTREHHSTTVEHSSGPTVVHHHPGVVESAVVHRQEPRVHAVVHHDVPAVENAIVHHHEPVVHEVLRPAVVAEHNELVYTPHHEHSYSLDQTKVVQPKSSVVEHHPLTG